MHQHASFQLGYPNTYDILHKGSGSRRKILSGFEQVPVRLVGRADLGMFEVWKVSNDVIAGHRGSVANRLVYPLKLVKFLPDNGLRKAYILYNIGHFLIQLNL